MGAGLPRFGGLLVKVIFKVFVMNNIVHLLLEGEVSK